MADILIRGMEMPKHCLFCPLMVDRYETDACALQSQEANEAVESWDDLKRGCPLAPLPEGHGRLGDLDKLVANFREAAEECKRLADAVNSDRLTEVNNKAIYAAIIEAVLRIKAAPTIVPAEGGGEDG